jgi:hypothetical protein
VEEQQKLACDQYHEKSIFVGDYCFNRTNVESVYGFVGNWHRDIIGYNETFSNDFVSQEVTDALMRKYKDRLCLV